MSTTASPVKITVSADINAPVEKVWKLWNTPEDIMQWNCASPDWHSPRSENDLRVGGSFSTRMEARDGSFGFDFGGIYDVVDEHRRISYTMGDNRKVDVHFTTEGGVTKVIETFDAESQNPVEMQQGGWQAILDSFKNYAEKQ